MSVIMITKSKKQKKKRKELLCPDKTHVRDLDRLDITFKCERQIKIILRVLIQFKDYHKKKSNYLFLSTTESELLFWSNDLRTVVDFFDLERYAL